MSRSSGGLATSVSRACAALLATVVLVVGVVVGERDALASASHNGRASSTGEERAMAEVDEVVDGIYRISTAVDVGA